MRHLLSTLLVLAILAPAAHASTVSTGKHTYQIDVTNAAGRPIYDAYVNVSEMGDYSANITSRAQGYRDGWGTVSINPHQQMVYVRVRLEDPTVWVRVVDKAGAQINCFVDQNQFMANADEYRVEVQLPSTGFTKFQRQNVQTDMFATFINIWGADTARRVELRIPRRSFGFGFSQNIRIQIPTDAQLNLSPREAKQAKSFDALFGAE